MIETYMLWAIEPSTMITIGLVVGLLVFLVLLHNMGPLVRRNPQAFAMLGMGPVAAGLMAGLLHFVITPMLLVWGLGYLVWRLIRVD